MVQTKPEASREKGRGEKIPCEQLVRNLCDTKQGYTQFGGLRPFGVSLIYAGYDDHFGFQLYKSDPSGNYGGWTATAIGANNQAARSILKTEYKEDPPLEDALALAVKVLNKTMDSTSLNSEKSLLLFFCFQVIFHFFCISSRVCCSQEER